MAERREPNESFDPAALPIHGTRLIEASAGTGKTYNIANLYLLAVLGMGQDNPHEPLAVDRILVVTFTRAAAAELRGRIRALLEQAWLDFRTGRSRHAFIAQLIGATEKGRREDCIRHLYRALLRIDEAQISTIHGYALEVARRFLFEAGTLADLEVELGSGARVERLLKDLYRRLLSGSLGLPADSLAAMGLGREEHFRKYFGQVNPRHALLPEAFAVAPPASGSGARAAIESGPGLQALLDEHLDRRRKAFQSTWSALRDAWSELLSQSGGDEQLEQAVSSLLDPIPMEGERRRTRTGPWVRNAFSTQLAKDPFDATSIQTKSRPWGNSFSARRLRTFVRDPAPWAGDAFARDFLAFLQAYESFLAGRPTAEELRRDGLRALIAGLVQRAREHFDLAELNLDQLITLINRRLAADTSLRRQLLQAWPVCLVDEFQDTDPEQMDLFHGIYGPAGDDPPHGLFMIGDPKQSIYEFRGADIFNYLNMRRTVEVRQAKVGEQAIFSLDENFRSNSALVAATNALFAEKRIENTKENNFDKKRNIDQPIFLYEGIEYFPVSSSEARGEAFNKGELRLEGQGVDPLVFIGNGNSDGEFNAESLRLLYARDTAQRIAQLLRGQAVIEGKGARRRLRARDVAVLVRSSTEARKVREQLALYGLRSVYLSQRDSVFGNAMVAGDLYHVLAAMNEPDNRRRLRTALATPLLRGFAFEFTEVEAMAENDDAFENIISEFGEYRETWRRHGILTALNRLLERHGGQLLAQLAARPDSDRLLTDLRHLADLLQQQDAECDSPEQLLDWYAAQLEDDSQLDEDRKRIRLESDENLVQILTIHVAKGLEFPVVFLPFTFMARPVDMARSLPVYRCERDELWEPVIDFEGDRSEIQTVMQREAQAEDLRLLYVGLTRAIHQCQVGLSAMCYGRQRQPMFEHTPWAHLLREHLDPTAAGGMPTWDALRTALQRRLRDVDQAVAYRVAGDAGTARTGAGPSAVPHRDTAAAPEKPKRVAVRPSTWRVTSYSRLAHGHGIVLEERTDDDREGPDQPGEAASAQRSAPAPGQDDDPWSRDIRYTMRGGVQTGNCLHDILEERALDPAPDLRAIIERQLALRGLERPFRPRDLDDAEYRRRVKRYVPDLTDWLQAALEQPLAAAVRPDDSAAPAVPALGELLRPGRALPEMRFDFRLGRPGEDARFEAIDRVLAEHGHSTLRRPGSVSGLMTGAIDLLFIHEGRLYVADYKSNRLGAAPRFYDHAHMDAAMRENRYDLQYLIYAVAAERHFRQRLGGAWSFDDGEVSFGGVFYLFLRGMGLPAPHAGHGVWFSRPPAALIRALDRTLSGAEPAPGASRT